ncbi:MAG: bifunctional tetrahydrofolate synthase/dihydrofolate synthase [Proteobacteria bacterium]|nr:MAG: bifunctional tetrahydrofolate synthase/dihydrofolate synthase [Pseudomonadota bacterium]
MRFQRLSEWLSWQEQLHPRTIDLGLDRVRRTLERLGWRRPACPIVIVGGTNGKGSAVALLARIWSEAGYRCGTFTSPHLRRYNERIVLAGQEVADATLLNAFQRIDAARGSDTLTFFEFSTLAALLAFEDAALDAIVLEVGMGGRLDAVNIVDADAALITSVALDHCEWLGTDVAAIGREKAGVFRPGRGAIVAGRDMPSSVAQYAREIGSDLRRLGVEFDYQPGHRHTPGGPVSWSWRGRERTWPDLPPPALAGAVQFDNAAGVLAVVEYLHERLPVERQAIERGLAGVRVTGRFQVETIDGVEWILDVAHNPAAARTLAAQLAERPCAGRTLAVCGILGDKDVAGILAEVHTRFDLWVIAGLEGPRALDPATLAERIRGAGGEVAGTYADVATACAAAAQLARAGDRIVVFGSFLTIAAALEAFDDGRAPGSVR